MAASLAIGHTTLLGYLEREQEAGLNWPLPPEMADAELERLVSPRTAREAARRAFQPDWAYVHRTLRRSRIVILTCQLDHVRNRMVFVSPTNRLSSLCGSVQAQDAANATLGDLHLAAHKINASMAA